MHRLLGLLNDHNIWFAVSERAALPLQITLKAAFNNRILGFLSFGRNLFKIFIRKRPKQSLDLIMSKMHTKQVQLWNECESQFVETYFVCAAYLTRPSSNTQPPAFRSSSQRAVSQRHIPPYNFIHALSNACQLADTTRVTV